MLGGQAGAKLSASLADGKPSYKTGRITRDCKVALPPAIRLTAVDSTVPPGRDFYMYVNRHWQRSVHIPSFAGSFGISEEIEEHVRKDLLSTIRRLPTDHPLALLKKSIMNHGVQDNNVRDLRRFLQSFDCVRDREDLGRQIGYLNRIQSRAPITFAVNADTYRSNICRVHIYEPIMGLPARHYYVTKPQNRTILHYGTVLKQAGKLLEVEGLEEAIAIEKSVLPALSSGDSLRNPMESYIPKTLAELEREWKEIPWFPMLLGWGMPTDLIRTSTFIVTNSKYMDQLNHMFRTYDLSLWRIWMRAGVVLTFLEYLPPPFDDMHYELFQKRLRGSAQKMPQERLMLAVLQKFTTQALGKVFVEDHIPERVKDEAISMVRRLKTATTARIRAVPWMVAATKEKAVAKIRAMRFQVAYPSEWYSEFTGLTMDPERMFQNIINLAIKDSVRMINTLGAGCGDRDTWQDGSFDVNAYYYPDQNRLVIPGGMLRPPFFDLRRSVAWNYGGIGAAIGHEITHGFDADGKNYDVNGNYKEWWTAKDNETYEEMTKDLVEMYDGAEYLGGKVDGHLTLSENIADLGGVAIALQALQAYLKEHKATHKETLDAYRDFFQSYAVSWRNKDRPKKAKQSLFLDVHAPAPLRVNSIVRQFKEFYEAYGIKEGEDGWIPEKERVHLW
jgi:putative endopeptidase